MPTATGRPKAGEVWERRVKQPPNWNMQTIGFRVIQRGQGNYWSLRVEILYYSDGPVHAGQRRQLWVDAAAWHARGELHYIKEGEK